LHAALVEGAAFRPLRSRMAVIAAAVSATWRSLTAVSVGGCRFHEIGLGAGAASCRFSI